MGNQVACPLTRRHHATLAPPSIETTSGASSDGASPSSCVVVHASSLAGVAVVTTAEKNLSRRGQTEHPLNWVLVLIGGIVFLLVFFALIRVVVQGHERSVDTTTIAGLRAVVREAQASPGTVMNASVPEFTTRCDRGTLIAQLDRRDTPFDGQILFTTPDAGGDLVLWSESFELPGPVATVTYLIPKKTLVLYEDALPLNAPTNGMASLLPPEVTKRSFATNMVNDEPTKGFDTIIVVFKNTPSGTVQGDGNVHGVKIAVTAPQTTLLPAGDIEFYSYSAGSWTKIMLPATPLVPDKYYGKAMLMGVIAAGSRDSYLCGRTALDARLKMFASIQSKRTEILLLTPYLPGVCVTQYGIAKNNWYYLKIDGLSRGDIDDICNRLFLANQNLGRNNCALLY